MGPEASDQPTIPRVTFSALASFSAKRFRRPAAASFSWHHLTRNFASAKHPQFVGAMSTQKFSIKSERMHFKKLPCWRKPGNHLGCSGHKPIGFNICQKKANSRFRYLAGDLDIRGQTDRHSFNHYLACYSTNAVAALGLVQRGVLPVQTHTHIHTASS